MGLHWCIHLVKPTTKLVNLTVATADIADNVKFFVGYFLIIIFALFDELILD